ncbi:MAG: hypothetical protein EPN26_12900, partial [Rhodospirillales bacterium]
MDGKAVHGDPRDVITKVEERMSQSIGCSIVSAQCSSTAREILGALFKLAAERSADGHCIRLSDLHTIIEHMSVPSGPFDAFYAHRARSCLGSAKVFELDKRRTNALTRIILHPAEWLFDVPQAELPRGIMPRLVEALRMMLGCDLHEALQQRATAIAHAHRDEKTGVTDWEGVFASDEARAILLEALVALADCFRRFDLRKDWFLLFLNTNPASSAVASNAFFVRSAEERSRHKQIGDAQFSALMRVLFSSVHPD